MKFREITGAAVLVAVCAFLTCIFLRNGVFFVNDNHFSTPVFFWYTAGVFFAFACAIAIAKFKPALCFAAAIPLIGLLVYYDKLFSISLHGLLILAAAPILAVADTSKRSRFLMLTGCMIGAFGALCEHRNLSITILLIPAVICTLLAHPPKFRYRLTAIWLFLLLSTLYMFRFGKEYSGTSIPYATMKEYYELTMLLSAENSSVPGNIHFVKEKTDCRNVQELSLHILSSSLGPYTPSQYSAEMLRAILAKGNKVPPAPWDAAVISIDPTYERKPDVSGTLEHLQALKNRLPESCFLGVRLPDDPEYALRIVTNLKHLYKHVGIFRWSAQYAIASDTDEIITDADELDQRAERGKVYIKMLAPENLLAYALPLHQDRIATDAMLEQAAQSPVFTEKESRVLLGSVFTATCRHLLWLVPLLLVTYFIIRYWRAGFPDGKVPFQSLEDGFVLSFAAAYTACQPVFEKSVPVETWIPLLVCTISGIALFSFPFHGKTNIFHRIIPLVILAAMVLLNLPSYFIAALLGFCIMQNYNRIRQPDCFLFLTGLAIGIALAPFCCFQQWIAYPVSGCILLYFIMTDREGSQIPRPE